MPAELISAPEAEHDLADGYTWYEGRRTGLGEESLGSVAHRAHQEISTIMQWLTGISSRILLQECAHLRKLCWGRHLWARGYLAVSSGTITDQIVTQYIAEQEGEPIQDDSRFLIDDGPKLLPSRR